MFSKFCGNELNDLVLGFLVSCLTTLPAHQSHCTTYSSTNTTVYSMFPCIYTSYYFSLECSSRSIVQMESGPCLQKVSRRINTPLKSPFIPLLGCRPCWKIPNTFLFLSVTQQNISQPHLLFDMAIECEWKQCVYFMGGHESLPVVIFHTLFHFQMAGLKKPSRRSQELCVEDGTAFMCCWIMEILSEKCILRQFSCCVNIIERTFTT